VQYSNVRFRAEGPPDPRPFSSTKTAPARGPADGARRAPTNLIPAAPGPRWSGTRPGMAPAFSRISSQTMLG
jgi:hypothetical protein